MRAFALLSCLVLSLSASSLCAAPASELKILATDPAPDALMARNQPFFVRFEVKAPSPVTVSSSGFCINPLINQAIHQISANSR